MSVEKRTTREGPIVHIHRADGSTILGRIKRNVRFWEQKFEKDDRVGPKVRH